MVTNKCPHCNDTGKTTVANGPDDFDEVYCLCDAGRVLQEGSDMSGVTDDR